LRKRPLKASHNVSGDLVAKTEGVISVVTIQNTKGGSWHFSLVKDARDYVVRVCIQREDESLNEPLGEAVDKTEKKESNCEARERYSIVLREAPSVISRTAAKFIYDGFDGGPAAFGEGQHPGDLEC
jgi:hypothetical protein